MKKNVLMNNQGFTLVELLITVVIVGLLAAIGVPQYRKMAQKAKKAEAQTLLGAIYTAEESFYSEYGTYGNALNKMGINMKNNNKLLYRGGFTKTSGKCDEMNGDRDLFPSSVSGYDAYKDSAKTLLGREGQTACRDGSSVEKEKFVAVVTGYIRQTDTDSVKNGCDGDVNKCDAWKINQDGDLNNVKDGVEE